MWRTNMVTKCESLDTCTKAFGTNEGKCKGPGRVKCNWDDTTNYDECKLKTPTSNAECDNQDSEKECKAYENDDGLGCMYMQRRISRCSDFEACSYTDQDTCEENEAEEVCHWLKEDKECRAGKRPTTETTTTISATTTTTVTTTTTFHCKDDTYFMCKSGDQCIRKKFLCDGGAPDCDDDSDENGCGTTTEATTVFACSGLKTHMCASGDECIIKEAICDGEDDCADGSDEKGCATSSTITTTTTSTTTKTATTKTTTTFTKTSTTTTLDACITSGQCPSAAMFEDAQKDEPFFTTTAECRACQRGQSVEEVCIVFRTLNCPEERKKVDKIAKLMANKVTNFRAKQVGSMSNYQVIDELISAFGGYRALRPADIVDIELQDVAGSEWWKVVLFFETVCRSQGVDRRSACIR
jgi:hypothetical protein